MFFTLRLYWKTVTDISTDVCWFKGLISMSSRFLKLEILLAMTLIFSSLHRFFEAEFFAPGVKSIRMLKDHIRDKALYRPGMVLSMVQWCSSFRCHLNETVTSREIESRFYFQSRCTVRTCTFQYCSFNGTQDVILVELWDVELCLPEDIINLLSCFLLSKCAI